MPRELRDWRDRCTDAVARGRQRPNAPLDVLELSAAQIRLLEEQERREGVAVVGGIDVDGYWKSLVGPVQGLPAPGDADFLPRCRPIEIVWTREYFGVRKRYKGDFVGFLNELSILDRLGRHDLRVPSILDVDFDDPALVLSFIPGRVVRDELIRAGAPVRNRDRVKGWSHHKNVQRTLRLGRPALGKVLPRGFIVELAADLERFHDLGIMMLDINWGNIVIGHDGRPWWIDFNSAEDYSELSPGSFRALADLDVARFNQAFATDAEPLEPVYSRSSGRVSECSPR